jgi:magnesium transporter
MPELDARFGYPLIIAISLGVIAIEFWILKKRKII